MELTSRKVTNVSLNDKYQAIMCLLNKEKSIKRIQLELKVKPNTISDWLKKKDKIIADYQSDTLYCHQYDTLY